MVHLQRFIDGHIDRDVVRLDEENFDSSVASGHWMVQLCVVATRTTMCCIVIKPSDFCFLLLHSYAPFEKSKHSRDAWNVWTNLAAVALRTEEFNVARVMCSPAVNLGTSSPLNCGVSARGANPSRYRLVCALPEVGGD